MKATRSVTPFAMATLFSLATIHESSAQQPDSARCRALLSGPTRDSVVVRIGMMVTSFDSGSVISANYRSLFVDAVRQALKVPRPLPINLYGIITPTDDQGRIIRDGTVTPAIAGDYRATMVRDGHITRARVVGGARTKVFDDAVLAAIRAVGDSQTAPPFADEIKADSVEFRLRVGVIGNIIPVGKSVRLPDPKYLPLFAMRVPSFGFPSSVVKPEPNNPPPRYPEVARLANVDADLIADYIVTEDGKVDIASLQIQRAAAIQFVEAVLEVLPRYQFKPLAISGCPVASLVSMPFSFHLQR